MTTYAFGPAETLSITQVRAADPIRQAQVRATLEARLGGSYADLDACLAALADGGALDEDAFTIDRYAITRDGDLAYEACIVFVDNGLVFAAGAEEPTAVYCAQSRFWSVDDDDADAVALAEALNPIVPF